MPTVTRDIPANDTSYARDISFPMQFTDECDLLMDEDQEIIDQSLRLLTFIPVGQIRLFVELGSTAMLSVFDQLDDQTILVLDTSLRSAFDVFEPRVVLDRELVIDESADEKKIIAIVPYTIKTTGLESATRLVIDRPGEG